MTNILDILSIAIDGFEFYIFVEGKFVKLREIKYVPLKSPIEIHLIFFKFRSYK